MPEQGFRRQRTPGASYGQQGSTGERASFDRGPAFAPRFASDLIAARDIEEELRHGIVPIADIMRAIRANNQPPQLVQVGYPGLITAVGIANKVLLVPKNPDRMSMKVCNPTQNSAITMSWDAPVLMATIGLGIPIQAQQVYEESNGSVSINAIYVWTDNALATFPIPVIAYEGGLSIAGNKR